MRFLFSLASAFNLRPFLINVSSEVPHMLRLIEETRLLDAPEYPGVGTSTGISLDTLKSLRSQ
jgi:hypothetical protein